MPSAHLTSPWSSELLVRNCLRVVRVSSTPSAPHRSLATSEDTGRRRRLGRLLPGQDRRQEAGGRRQESGVRRQEAGVRSQKSVVRSQESGVRSQESGVRSQEAGVRSQESGVRSKEAGERSWE